MSQNKFRHPNPLLFTRLENLFCHMLPCPSRVSGMCPPCFGMIPPEWFMTILPVKYYSVRHLLACIWLSGWGWCCVMKAIMTLLVNSYCWNPSHHTGVPHTIHQSEWYLEKSWVILESCSVIWVSLWRFWPSRSSSFIHLGTCSFRTIFHLTVRGWYLPSKAGQATGLWQLDRWYDSSIITNPHFIPRKQQI